MNNQKKIAVYFMYMIDVMSLIISFVIAYLIKFNLIESEVNVYRSDYVILFLLIFIIYIIVNIVFMNHIEFINRNITQEVIESFKIIVYVSTLVMVCLFFLKNSASYSRAMMFIFMFVSFPVVFIGRIMLKRILHIMYRSDKYQEKIVIISDSKHICDVINKLKNKNAIRIVGAVLTDIDAIGKEYSGVDIIANSDNYLDVIQKKEIDSVFLSIEEKDYISFKNIIESLQDIGKNIHVRLPEYELCDGYKQFRKIGDFAAISYVSSKNMMFYQIVLRRSVEVILGCIGCILTIIIYLFAGIGMLIESPGKVIVSNVRVGKNGRKYLQYRFRIVKMDAQNCVDNGKSPFMIIGRILFRLHLDKLPGAYNLLCGDIGLIGPSSPSVAQYINYLPAQKRKLTIKPGIVGEWSYRKNDTELAATSENYDMPYEKNIKGDIKRFVMAMGRMVIYHPRRTMEQWEIQEQINTVKEIIADKEPYQYDRSIYIVHNSFGRIIYLIIKRVFDIVLSAIGLIVLSPIFLILMICVIAEDGGNPFYGHIRIGRNGKRIRVYKFRSMKNIDVDIEKILTPEQLLQYRTEFKIDNDPRITKVGNFLRKSSLDELPQLINILKGDISIVGPRPIVEKEIKIYGKDTAKLLSVQPGLTGYWQAYARNNATYESGERQKMEMYYVEHQSLWLDIKIIFKTFSSVVKGSGAQ